MEAGGAEKQGICFSQRNHTLIGSRPLGHGLRQVDGWVGGLVLVFAFVSVFVFVVEVVVVVVVVVVVEMVEVVVVVVVCVRACMCVCVYVCDWVGGGGSGLVCANTWCKTDHPEALLEMDSPIRHLSCWPALRSDATFHARTANCTHAATTSHRARARRCFPQSQATPVAGAARRACAGQPRQQPAAPQPAQPGAPGAGAGVESERRRRVELGRWSGCRP